MHQYAGASKHIPSSIISHFVYTVSLLGWQAGLAEQQLAELLKEHNSKQGRADQRGSAIRKLMRAILTPLGYKPIILLTLVFAFEQFSGIYIIMFYSVTFLEVRIISVKGTDPCMNMYSFKQEIEHSEC